MSQENESGTSGWQYCFLPGPVRMCTFSCMAYVEEGKTHCRILNTIEKLIPLPTRPIAPPPPKV